MLLKLLRFVIVSRISKPLLVLLAVLAIYFVVITPRIYSSVSFIHYYYGPLVVVFLLVYPVLTGGIGVLKSDRDFLFTLPVRRVDLAFSLFIIQFLSFGFIVFYLYSYISSYLQSLFPFSIVEFIAIALASTSLGPIAYSFRLRWRALIAVLLGIWSLSSYLGFQYSPSSIFTGSTLYPMIASIGLAIVTVPLSFRSLSRVDLDLMKTIARYSSSEAKHITTFSGMTPLRAIFTENFLEIEISGRMNTIGAGASYRAGRIRLTRGFLVVALLSIILYYFVDLRSPASSLVSVLFFILSIYSVALFLFFSTGVLGNERLWLGFMAEEPVRYLRSITALKSLSMAVLLSPLSIISFLEGLKGVAGGLLSGLTLLVTVPSLLAIEVYLSAYIYPVQIKEELTMPSQLNLRQVAALAPMLVVWLFNVLAYSAFGHGLFPRFIVLSLISPLLMAAIALYLIGSRKMGKMVIEQLVKAGFT